MSTGEHVELRDLRIFLAVAESLHFGRAARDLGFSQARVSQIVRELERAVGGPLFVRTSRRVELTSLGKRLQESIACPLRDLRAALEAAEEIAGGISGRVTLGYTTPVAGGPLMVKIVRSFCQKYPGACVEELDLGLDRDPIACLHRKEIDLLATRLPIDREGIEVGPLLSSEARVLAVSVDHPLAKHDTVSWDAVADYMVPSAPAFPIEALRDLVPESSPSGCVIRRGPAVRTFSELLLQVARGDVVHPTVRSFDQYHQHPQVTTIPLSSPTPSRSGLVWSSIEITPAARAFVDCAREIIAEYPIM
ncbi:LysR family transcriptional regulator [Nocardia sp. NPDC058658]|uniref:LysR family transcriptional regulator n=1 Tax=Nocardia sp. NPDC058658 TaxID=3346580 RepID=UPI0036514A0F